MAGRGTRGFASASDFSLDFNWTQLCAKCKLQQPRSGRTRIEIDLFSDTSGNYNNHLQQVGDRHVLLGVCLLEAVELAIGEYMTF